VGHGGRAGRRGGGAEIEFLAPDTHAFAVSSADGFHDVGGDRPDEFDGDESPRSPWTTLATAAAVLGIFALGLVVAAPWETEPVSQPPETTTTTTSTTVAPTTTDEVTIEGVTQADAGYVADPPAGFEVAALYTATADVDAGWMELRVSPGASRTSGTWIAVQLTRGNDRLSSVGGRRVDLGEKGIGLLSRSPDEVATLRFLVSPSIAATITGGGWTDEQLIELAAGMGHVGFQPVFANAILDELELVGSVRTNMPTLAEMFAIGDERAGLTYRRRGDDRFIRISVTPKDPLIESLVSFVLAEDPDFPFSGPATTITLNGRRLVGGLLPDLEDVRMVRWTEGDEGDEEVVTITSNLDLADLLDEVVPTVEGATTAAWGDAMLESRGFGPTQLRLDEAGSGQLASGADWRVDIDAFGDFAILSAKSRQATVMLNPADAPLHVFSTLGATVVLALVPSAEGAGLTLRVVTPAATVETSLAPAGAIGTPTVAVHAFDDLGPFTAQVLDAERNVIASFGDSAG
jgi:hypothetical protein